MSTRTTERKTELPEELASQLREIEGKLQVLEALLKVRA